MANRQAVRRLSRELVDLSKEPVPFITAVPNPKNILEVHYVITGPPQTPFAGGIFHGKVTFPPEYPMKPPQICMLTPSGRFKPGARLCLSMSDFHPESWNPLWSLSSILSGLLSFMLETDKATVGSVSSSDADKRRLARLSLRTNQANPTFRKLFPELAALDELPGLPDSASAAAASSAASSAAGSAGAVAAGDIAADANGDAARPKLAALGADDPVRALLVAAVLLVFVAWLAGSYN